MGTSVLMKHTLRAACTVDTATINVMCALALGSSSQMFSVSQLPEWLGQDLWAELRPDSAGCAAYTCEDHWHRGNSLHLQRSLFQVSIAQVVPLFIKLYKEPELLCCIGQHLDGLIMRLNTVIPIELNFARQNYVVFFFNLSLVFGEITALFVLQTISISMLVILSFWAHFVCVYHMLS